MKQFKAFIFLSFLLFLILLGIVYLKSAKPNVYHNMVYRIEILFGKAPSDVSQNSTSSDKSSTSSDGILAPNIGTTQEISSNTLSTNSSLPLADSSTVTNVPIDTSTQDSTSDATLKSAQKTDLVPLEGIGKEISDTANSSMATGRLGEEYSFSSLMYPYFSMLNVDEQKVYKQIYANILDYNAAPFGISVPLSIAQMDDVMVAVYNDHPELFWLETKYSYLYKKSGTVSGIILKFNETINDIENQKNKFNQIVNSIVSSAAGLPSDIEKEKYVHDYLVDHVTYDESASMHQTAYSALVNGRSVCAGYSRAFQHILMQLNIPTYYCTGVADAGPHAWNIMKLGNNFYNVDTLWDDSITEAYNLDCYLYFNIPDNTFNSEHQRTGLSINLPACTSTEMSYKTVYGDPIPGGLLTLFGFSEAQTIKTLDEYNAYCITSLTSAGVGTSSFTVPLENKGVFDIIYADMLNEGYLNGYLSTVSSNLGLGNCSIDINYAYVELIDGHLIYTQETTLTDY